MGGGVMNGRPELIIAIRERAFASLGGFYTAADMADDFLMPARTWKQGGTAGGGHLGLSALGH